MFEACKKNGLILYNPHAIVLIKVVPLVIMCIQKTNENRMNLIYLQGCELVKHIMATF